MAHRRSPSTPRELCWGPHCDRIQPTLPARRRRQLAPGHSAALLQKALAWALLTFLGGGRQRSEPVFVALLIGADELVVSLAEVDEAFDHPDHHHGHRGEDGPDEEKRDPQPDEALAGLAENELVDTEGPGHEREPSRQDSLALDPFRASQRLRRRRDWCRQLDWRGF